MNITVLKKLVLWVEYNWIINYELNWFEKSKSDRKCESKLWSVWWIEPKKVNSNWTIKYDLNWIGNDGSNLI